MFSTWVQHAITAFRFSRLTPVEDGKIAPTGTARLLLYGRGGRECSLCRTRGELLAAGCALRKK